MDTSITKSIKQYVFILTPESSDDEDDSSYGYYSIHDSRYPRNRANNSNQPSKMCLCLKIEKGKIAVTTNSPVRILMF